MINLSLKNQEISLSGAPGEYPQGDLTIMVRPGSKGVNTLGVQDIILRQGESQATLHLSGHNGRRAISCLDGQTITALRVNP